MVHREHALTAVVAPVVGGLVVLVTLLGLIGTAIRDPHPRDVPVGLVGPSAAIQHLSDGFSSNSPGTFQFTTYSSEHDARAALDSNDVDAVVIIGPDGPDLIVAGAAGDAVSGLITAVFTGAFAAQGSHLTIETTHPLSSGDPHGLILFFLVLATIISTFVAQVVLFLRGGSAGLATRLVSTSLWAVIGAATGVGVAAWLVGGYDSSSAEAMFGLLTLTSLAVGASIAGMTRLLGAPGIGIAGLVVVLLDLISSGGPAGPYFLPDAYRALTPWMPAGQLVDALRSVLYFDGSAATRPVLVIAGWLVGGLVLLLIAEAMVHRVRKGSLEPAAVSA